MLTSPSQGKTLLLIGGTSEIALSIANTVARQESVQVVLAARPGQRRDEAGSTLAGLGCTVETLDFDATDLDQSVPLLGEVFDRLDVDIAVVAHGVLPDQDHLEVDPKAAVEVCTINYTSAVVVGLLLADRMRTQGHGVIVAVSSVAGVRPRVVNYVYGSSKAGLDAFYTGLRDRLHGSGVRVLVVRPGHVHTGMTAGLPPAPFAVPVGRVADAVVARLGTGNQTVWVPAVLGPVMTGLRLMPAPLFRRLAAGTISQRPLRRSRAR